MSAIPTVLDIFIYATCISDDEKLHITTANVQLGTKDQILDLNVYIHSRGEFNPGLVRYYVEGEEFKERMGKEGILPSVIHAGELHIEAPLLDDIRRQLELDSSDLANDCRMYCLVYDTYGWDVPDDLGADPEDVGI